jgi:tRNA modification GTPase
VLAAIGKCDTADHPVRYAEPGEFTRRAFMNDRLDLPQIEALGDTLTADTEQQRRLAVRGASDTLSKRYELWRRELLYARGELEALIDFSEDQHFDESPQEFINSVGAQVRVLRRQIDLHIQNASKGELLRNGIKVALLGAPNAGKSSLLNRIVGKEAAIVSTEEGTTRDIVDVGVDLGGWYCKLGDMAGLRSGPGGIGAVEQEGIRRAKARALESDVVVVVLSVEQTADGGIRLAVEDEVVEAVRSCQVRGKSIVVAINKSDRLPKEERGCVQAPRRLMERVSTLFANLPEDQIYAISCKQAQDELPASEADPGQIQAFLRGLIATFERIAAPEGVDGENNASNISYWEDSLGVTHRQRSNLQKCLQHLDDFLTQTQPLDPNPPNDLQPTPSNASHDEFYRNNTVVNFERDIDIVTAAEHLRFAADSLAKITGTGESGDVEDVLGVVFEKYAGCPVCCVSEMLTSCVETGSVSASDLPPFAASRSRRERSSKPSSILRNYSSSSWISLYPPRPCIDRYDRYD